MVKKFEDIFIRFRATHERDGQTDGHRIMAYTPLMHMHRAVKIASKLAIKIQKLSVAHAIRVFDTLEHWL